MAKKKKKKNRKEETRTQALTPVETQKIINQIRKRFSGLEIDEIIWILKKYGWQALINQRKRGWLQITVHHKKPRSRNGKNNEKNKKYVDEKTHLMWHRLFENLTPEEIIKILIASGKSPFIRNNLTRKEAWKYLFDDKTNQEVIEIIKNEWS